MRVSETPVTLRRAPPQSRVRSRGARLSRLQNVPSRELSPSRAEALALGSRRIPFRADIQGLRAVAVLLVVLYHARLPGLSGGYVGVDVFFVISGFLITAHLLASLGSEGRIDFAGFFAKRVRRILPASAAALALTVAACVFVIPPLILPPVLNDAIFTNLYVPNFLFAQRRVDYLSDPNPSVFQHYWSLGVEEQFYVVWPLLLVISFVVLGKRPGGILAALIVTFGLSVALCWWLTMRSQPWAFFMMPTRAWEFAAGGIVAFIVTSTRASLAPRWGRAAGWLGLAVLLVSAFTFSDETQFPGTAAILPVAATAVVILAGSSSPIPWSAARILARRPLVFVGAISYSMYLVHWPLLAIPQIVYSDRHALPVPVTLALAAASVPIAWLIYALVENPARSWPLLKGRRPRVTLFAAAAVTVLIAAPLMGVAASVETRPLYTTEVVPSASPVDGVPTPFVPANLVPSLRAASSDNPAIYANGCHLFTWEQTRPLGCTVGDSDAPITVALFGDSHAAQWYPGFAKVAADGEVELANYTMSSCPSANIATTRSKGPHSACRIWRTAVVEELVSNPPDIVVLANFAETAGDVNHPSVVEAWGAGLAETVVSLSAASNVIILTDTPHFEIAPSVCLSANLDNAAACSASPQHALWPAISELEKSIAIAHGGVVVDFTPILCSPTSCPVILNNVLVYRDSHHLTATFAESLAPALLDELKAVSSAR
jgi:peptidoglycan/LPS O-acetylase OafA/YrhL